MAGGGFPWRGYPAGASRRGMRRRGGPEAYQPPAAKEKGEARRCLKVEWRGRPAGESAMSRRDGRRRLQVARRPRESLAAAGRKGNWFFLIDYIVCRLG
jgi:hypothetical protein